MIIENELFITQKEKPNVEIKPRVEIDIIINCILQTCNKFKNHLSDLYANRHLNEDELTQVFVTQLNINLRKEDYPFCANSQYRDIYQNSTGISDFYFHTIEENRLTSSIFSVEAKRLPTPGKIREKEYVIGDNRNGGIERYKLGIHGRGLPESGMLGYVEKKSFDEWGIIINQWINELSTGNGFWNNSEILKKIDTNEFSSYLLSDSNRLNQNTIRLHHIWIYVC